MSHLAPTIRLIVILGFTAWGYGLRNSGDLWGKVFFSWFYAWDFGDMVLRGFTAWVFGLGFWAKE